LILNQTGEFVAPQDESSKRGADLAPVLQLDPLDAAYLTQLNTEILYGQKAYAMALAHMRRRYNAPEGAWKLDYIETGFERVTNGAS